ncbi:T-cell surface glycoprotein CD1b-1-like [Physeter macrocephalus]|uniref:T-cell surface glycoprotein CD1b-1-like n=1 Tax=Physeter macrocephalus TaxID=9755 RepID=A0A9W2WKY4_PHYMC|nr:T-cell surface glycoprotein CD1b-1-like [Physeter catodon]
MLLLPLLLLAVIVPGGDNEDAFQGPTSYHIIQILTFANSTWARNQASGWLDDIQIHGCDSDSGTAIFLKPWSKGNFSDEEMIELEDLFRAYFIGFTQKVQDYVSKFQVEYPYVIQGITGCELHSGKSIGSFLRGEGGLPHLRQLDIFGNISALLGPFDMSCIMVFEALVLSEYLMSPHRVSISIWDQ